MTYKTLQVRRDGYVQIIGLNRPDKRNAFDSTMLLNSPPPTANSTPTTRCARASCTAKGPCSPPAWIWPTWPATSERRLACTRGRHHPWQVERQLSKPLVVAVTARSSPSASSSCSPRHRRRHRISHLRPTRNRPRHLPIRGRNHPLPPRRRLGQRDAVDTHRRHLDATKAHRIGIVQEIVPYGEHLDRAVEIAQTIARQAPLGVQATLQSARQAIRAGEAAAEAQLVPTVQKLFTTENAAIGVQAFLTRTTADFVGR